MSENIKSYTDSLPVDLYREEIIKANREQVTIIVGETGSGKSTRIPQFIVQAIWEKKIPYKKVSVILPRRIAVVKCASYVNSQLKNYWMNNKEKYSNDLTEASFDKHEIVGHRVRFFSTITPETLLGFYTTGSYINKLKKRKNILEREILILDEVHERSAAVDLILGVIKTFVSNSSSKLHVILMSATINLQSFTSYFPSAKVIRIDTITYPITDYFANTQPKDILEETVNCIIEQHITQQDTGNILVFLPGEKEILQVQNELRRKLISQLNMMKEIELNFREIVKKIKEDDQVLELWINCLSSSEKSKSRQIILDYYKSQGNESIALYLYQNLLEALKEMLNKKKFKPCEIKAAINSLSFRLPVTYQTNSSDSAEPPKNYTLCLETSVPHIIPFHAGLDMAELNEAFTRNDDKFRKIILATNVAETALTIPDIMCVIDSGLVKINHYEFEDEAEVLKMTNATSDMIRQRRGRAGRERPGSVYHLYTQQSLLNNETQKVEVERVNLESLVLQLLVMGFDAYNFPFISKPSSKAILHAYTSLRRLGAVETANQVTPLGKILAEFPLNPREAYFLLYSSYYECEPEALTLTAFFNCNDAGKLDIDFSQLGKTYSAFQGDHAVILQLYNHQVFAKNIPMQLLGTRILEKIPHIRRQLQNICLRHNPKFNTVIRKLRAADIFNLQKWILYVYSNNVAMHSEKQCRMKTYKLLKSMNEVKLSKYSQLSNLIKKPKYVIFRSLHYTTENMVDMRLISPLDGRLIEGWQHWKDEKPKLYCPIQYILK